MTDRPRWGATRRMTELESTMWRANRHPGNSTQGVILEVFAGTPAWDDVLKWHEDGLAAFPRFRQRVVEPALPVGPPAWADDETFDLGYHLRRMRLPKPGSTDQLLEVAQAIGCTPLDPSRPPWTGTFVEGLEGGRSAYVLVVHHCLMDGHGSIQLLSQLHTGQTALSEESPEKAPNPWELAAEHLGEQARSLPKLAAKALSLAADAARDPAKAGRYAASMARVLAPPPVSGSPLLGTGPRSAWRYGMLECPLADLKAAGRAVGGTVNDAYVAAMLGGLRRYHEKRGLEIGDITVNMPVSMRTGGDAQGGNRFTSAFFTVPSSVVDPVKRLQALREAVSSVSGEPALDLFSLALPVLNRAPAAVLTPLFTGLQDRTDLTISNVPGMTETGRFAGHDVESVYYFGPLPGSPVTAVLHSHAGTCCIGVNCDGDVFDRDDLIACLREGIDEILALRPA